MRLRTKMRWRLVVRMVSRRFDFADGCGPGGGSTAVFRSATASQARACSGMPPRMTKMERDDFGAEPAPSVYGAGGVYGPYGSDDDDSDDDTNWSQAAAATPPRSRMGRHHSWSRMWHIRLVLSPRCVLTASSRVSPCVRRRARCPSTGHNVALSAWWRWWQVVDAARAPFTVAYGFPPRPRRHRLQRHPARQPECVHCRRLAADLTSKNGKN